MKKCDKCGIENATVYQQHTRRFLCKKCFLEDIRSRVEYTIKKYKLIDKNDSVLLAVSGGKDSFVLLDVLSQIVNPSRLIALSIIEGIPGYNRLIDVKKMEHYAQERGIDFILTSIKEVVGNSLEEIVKRSREHKLGVSACTFCGGLRRKIINLYAREVGASKTATAHNLDDEVQTLIMNLMRGDIARILRQHPLAPSLSSKFVYKIKPLRLIYEWEAAMYSYLKGFVFQETECPFITEQPTFRARIRRWLFQLEKNKPGTMLKIMQSFDKLIEKKIYTIKEMPVLPECKYCGEPTSYNRDVCKICELLISSSIKPYYKVLMTKTKF